MASTYATGTVTVSANATALTGTGTAWAAAAILPGALLYAVGLPVPIPVKSVTSETAIVLEAPSPVALSGVAYRIVNRIESGDVVDLLSQLLRLLTRAFDLDGSDQSISLATVDGDLWYTFGTPTEDKWRFGISGGAFGTFRFQRKSGTSWFDVLTIDGTTGVTTWDGSPTVEATYLEGLVAAAEAAAASIGRGSANGVAPLDGDSKVPAAYLPSYVDDVVEANNAAALPATGETGKIYVTKDNNKTWRWSGSTYVEISASPGSTDAVTEGSTNFYFTTSRVLATALTGISLSTVAAITASDTILTAFGKVQAQITGHVGSTNGHPNATTSAAGFMSAADKKKSDKIVSPHDFNVVANGVADDYAAFAAAAAAVGTKGVVTVYAGTYYIGTALSGQRIWNIVGEATITGPGATLPGVVREFAAVTDAAHPFYVGPHSKWVDQTNWTAMGSPGTTPFRTSEAMFVSSWGNVGSSSGSRSSDATPGSASAIGAFNWVIVDNASKGWSQYLEAFHKTGALWTVNTESDIIVLGGAVSVLSPHLPYATNIAGGFWIAAGGEASGAYDASFALAVVANGAKFKRGIVFGQGSIATTDGVDAIAMSAADNHKVSWYNSAGSMAGRIYCSVSSTTYAAGLLFGEYGAVFQHVTGSASWAQFFGTSSSANYPTFKAGNAGVPIEILAAGSDTNIDILLTPKGTGRARFGTYTATTVTHTGYVTIKTADGVEHKLMVGA